MRRLQIYSRRLVPVRTTSPMKAFYQGMPVN